MQPKQPWQLATSVRIAVTTYMRCFMGWLCLVLRPGEGAIMHRTISEGEEPEFLTERLRCCFSLLPSMSVKPREGVPSQLIEKAESPHVR